MPQPLQVIKAAFLMVKNVDDHITEVEQHPHALAQPLTVLTVDPLGAQLALNGLGQALHMPGRAPAHNHKIIGEGGESPDIQHHQILGLGIQSDTGAHSRHIAACILTIFV